MPWNTSDVVHFSQGSQIDRDNGSRARIGMAQFLPNTAPTQESTTVPHRLPPDARHLIPLSPQDLGPAVQAQLGAPRVELLDDGAQDDLEQLVAGQLALAGAAVGDGVDDVADLGLLVELVVEVVEGLLALDVGAAQAEQLDAHLVGRRVGGVQLARDVDDGRLDVVVEGARRQHDQVQRRALLARLELLDVPLQQLPTVLFQGSAAAVRRYPRAC